VRFTFRPVLTAMAFAAVLLVPSAAAAQQDTSHAMNQAVSHEATMAPRGTFTGGHGHTTTGSYEVVSQDGQRSLVLGADFSLDKAPDPYVVLSPDGKGDTKGALNLGRLSQLKGSSRYAIPAGTDLAGFTKVVIWCKKYDVTLGLADVHGAKDAMMH
jgi:electron transfer DM13